MEKVGGGQLTRRQHLLSRDGRLLIVCLANNLRVYSAVTGEMLFELEGHIDEVTALSLDPLSPAQVYSCSKDGTIALWDLQNGIRLDSWTVGNEPIESMVVIGSKAYLTVFWRDSQAGRALLYDLSKSTLSESRIKLSKPQLIAASASGNLVATFDRHTVLVWTAEQFGKVPALALHHTKPITCIAIRPDGSQLAAGDATGRILIWHDVSMTLASQLSKRGEAGSEQVKQEEPPVTTVHWHAHAVACLLFSLDGVYLLSGGQEAVLVMWEAASGRRAYLPRLGAPLAGIAGCQGDMARYAIRQSDNTLRIVNSASMTVEASVHGLRPRPRFLPNGPESVAPIVFQPGTGYSVVSGPHSILQWYDFVRDRHVDRLQLTTRNVVSVSEATASAQLNNGAPPPEPVATAVEFSNDGSCMATLESRPGVENSLQYTLKFWDLAPPESAEYGRPYILNTMADNPHRSTSGIGTVTGLAYHPSVNVAITTSDVGEFKIWSKKGIVSRVLSDEHSTDGTKQSEESSKWGCLAVGTFRNEPLTSVAFSSDGSVFAIGSAHGSITLWDAKEMAMLATLPPVFIGQPVPPGMRGLAVRQLMFVTNSPFLVARFPCGVAVYNTLTLRCEWGEVLEIGRIAKDRSSQHWAGMIAVKDKKNDTKQNKKKENHELVLFKGDNRHPVAAWNVSSRGMLGSCEVAFVLPGTQLFFDVAGRTCLKYSPIAMMNSVREYAIVHHTAGSGSLHPGKQAIRLEQLQSTKPSSAFEALYGTAARAENNKNTETDGNQRLVEKATAGSESNAWAKLFDAPSHALPPIGILCPAFLELVVMGGETATGNGS